MKRVKKKRLLHRGHVAETVHVIARPGKLFLVEGRFAEWFFLSLMIGFFAYVLSGKEYDDPEALLFIWSGILIILFAVSFISFNPLHKAIKITEDNQRITLYTCYLMIPIWWRTYELSYGEFGTVWVQRKEKVEEDKTWKALGCLLGPAGRLILLARWIDRDVYYVYYPALTFDSQLEGKKVMLVIQDMDHFGLLMKGLARHTQDDIWQIHFQNTLESKPSCEKEHSEDVKPKYY